MDILSAILEGSSTDIVYDVFLFIDGALAEHEGCAVLATYGRGNARIASCSVWDRAGLVCCGEWKGGVFALRRNTSPSLIGLNLEIGRLKCSATIDGYLPLFIPSPSWMPSACCKLPSSVGRGYPGSYCNDAITILAQSSLPDAVDRY